MFHWLPIVILQFVFVEIDRNQMKIGRSRCVKIVIDEKEELKHFQENKLEKIQLYLSSILR